MLKKTTEPIFLPYDWPTEAEVTRGFLIKGNTTLKRGPMWYATKEEALVQILAAIEILVRSSPQ